MNPSTRVQGKKDELEEGRRVNQGRKRKVEKGQHESKVKKDEIIEREERADDEKERRGR